MHPLRRPTQVTMNCLSATNQIGRMQSRNIFIDLWFSYAVGKDVRQFTRSRFLQWATFASSSSLGFYCYRHNIREIPNADRLFFYFVHNTGLFASLNLVKVSRLRDR